jgi:unsaturated rhamnogalacturonyl hydrolase
MTEELKQAQKVALDYIAQADPKMKWTWGEGLLGYAFSELDKYMETEDFTKFLLSYCDYYVVHQPEVCSSDTSAPGLITYAMYKKTKKKEYKALTDKVIDYIEHEPRLIDGAVNHFGHNGMSKFYPQSIWVDSLMMFSLFPAIYANENGEMDLMKYAAGLPEIFSKYLQDPSGLWYHSYWVKQHHTCPAHKVFWGRGNGWVMASLPLVYEQLPDSFKEKEQIKEIFIKTAEAFLPCQCQDGLFRTILNLRSYEETSTAALFASGIFNGLRLGLLSGDKYYIAGLKAYQGVLNNLKEDKRGRLVMKGISGPTIPLPPFTALNYRLIAKKANWSYGVAALIFAAIAYDKLQKKDS